MKGCRNNRVARTNQGRPGESTGRVARASPILPDKNLQRGNRRPRYFYLGEYRSPGRAQFARTNTCPAEEPKDPDYFVRSKPGRPGETSFVRVKLVADPKWETFSFLFQSEIQGIRGQYKGETTRAYCGTFPRVLRAVMELCAHLIGAKEEEGALEVRAERESEHWQ